MDQQLHFITVATPDLDAARAFYREGLGWTPMLDVPGEIIFFQVAPGLLLGLFDDTKFAQDRGVPGPTGGVSGLTLSHNVASPAEVDATVDRLVKAGASLTKTPQESVFGGIYHGHVKDPNGVVWEIGFNPGWRIDEDGTVSLG